MASKGLTNFLLTCVSWGICGEVLLELIPWQASLLYLDKYLPYPTGEETKMIHNYTHRFFLSKTKEQISSIALEPLLYKLESSIHHHKKSWNLCSKVYLKNLTKFLDTPACKVMRSHLNVTLLLFNTLIGLVNNKTKVLHHRAADITFREDRSDDQKYYVCIHTG